MSVIPVEEFFGTADSKTPLFARDPGWLKTLQNMRVKPGGGAQNRGGWLEARGGQDALKPSGGTTAAIDSTGIISGFHGHSQNQGVAIGVAGDGITYSIDIGRYGSFYLFGPATNLGNPPVLGVNDTDIAWHFGSLSIFSRLSITLTRGTSTGTSTYGVTWEYWNGAAWAALTGATENFYTAGLKEITWSIPSNWAPTSVNGIYLYWVRCRITTTGVADQDSWIVDSPILSDWTGRASLLAAGVTPSSGGANGKLLLYGQTTGGAATWTNAFAPFTVTLSSGPRTRARMATFQDRVLLVNGKEQKRLYGGDNDIGLTGYTGGPTLIITPTVDAVNNFGQACVYDYGVTIGYGPGGLWGEGPLQMSSSGPTTFAANQKAVLSWASFVTDGQRSRVNVYRTDDLTGIPVTSRAEQPMFRVSEILPTDPGTLPNALTDYTRAFPFPQREADIVDRTPPSRCSYIDVLRGRVVLAASEAHPNRVWWSEAGNGESFDQEEHYAELKERVAGIAVAFDTIFAWSEDEMIGVSDLDEDIPNVFEVPGGKGCVAGDAVTTDGNVLIWPSRDGVYAMGQDLQVVRITPDHGDIFGRMSVETHGGSRAEIYDSMYDIHLLSPAGVPVGSQPRWRYDLVRPHWNTSTVSRSPLAVVTAPLGHADFGVPHPIFGNVNPSVDDRTPYVGEWTTADAGTGFDCIADIHFGPKGFQVFKPRRFAAYYQADSGWGTPVISTPPGATYVLSPAPGFGTGTPVAGTDYKLIASNCAKPGLGSQDIVIRFKATTVDGGAVRNQRLAACYLDGDFGPMPPLP